MSCNGCRVLRKGCSESCILRPCLQWIESPDAQANATLFVAKFFGRSDLMSFISAVPDHQKPVVFQSLLFEACGRTVNPVNGAVGLLWTGNWQECQRAVDAVLSGGTLIISSQNFAGNLTPDYDESSETFCSAWKARDRFTPFNACKEAEASDLGLSLMPNLSTKKMTSGAGRKRSTTSFNSDEQSSSAITSLQKNDDRKSRNKLLNLFV